MDEVLNFIVNKTCLNHNDYVVIGLSGGPDSMALLDILIRYRKDKKYNIVCAHVNHNLRIESDDEALFVKDYCNKNNIIFEMVKLDYEGQFTEALGHKCRYEYFENIINKYGAKYLFTAHHGDDLVETIMMRLVRGSSFNGYKGFSQIVRRNGYTILRPLVFVTKEHIMNYLNINNIPYVVDNSNNDISYTRNRYRKFILPKLKEENKNVHLQFLNFSRDLIEYQDFINNIVNEKYKFIVIDNCIDVQKIKLEHIVILKGILYEWLLYNFKDNIVNINDKHVNDIINIINSDKPNISIDLPKCKVVKSYNRLYIEYGNRIDNYEYEIKNKVILPNGHIIEYVDSTDKTSNYVTHLNSDELRLPLYVRNYRDGDKMTIKNMDGHKKIKDIFINEKVDKSIRYKYPVVVDSLGNVVWLPGIKKSAFDNKKNGKYDIILEYN